MCNNQFNNKCLLEIHNIKNNIPASSRCLICNKRYKSITHHLNNYHKEIYKENKENKTVKNLYENDDNLKCKFCDFKSLKQNLINHIKNRHMVEKIKCEKCNKIIKKSTLYSHNKNVHLDKNKIKCDMCNIYLKNEKIYKQHLNTESHIIKTKYQNIDHANISRQIRDIKIDKGKITSKKITNFYCQECRRYFNRKYDLDRHMNTIHCDKVYNCNICNKNFRQLYCLKRHVNTIHENKKFKCDKCDKEFKRTDTLKRHRKNIHNPVYITCDYCHKKILEREYYERHLKSCLIKQNLYKYPGVSSWERMTSKYLIENNIDFTSQCKFEDLKHINCLSYDFYIPKNKILLEIHGKQHYLLTNYKNSTDILKRIQKRDMIKKEYAKNNGFIYIEVDTRKNLYKQLKTVIQKFS